jgi:NADPH:quinone reductase-like Zn-dependent oxidoreductase
MRAVVVRQYGGIEQLRYEEIPTPKPGFGEILVAIRAAAVNHFDHDIREGISGIRQDLPHILGVEGAGEVEAIGEGVTSVKPGDRVIPYNLFCGRCRTCLSGLENICLRGIKLGVNAWGTYADYVKVGEHHVVRIPDGLSFEIAAASPVCFGTAWQMTVALGRIQAGEDVLINAVGSGVGSSALQIAKLHGARVIATAGSDAKLERARAMGADETVNYSRESIADAVLRLTDGKGADLVIESVGGAVLTDSLKALRFAGRLVTCGAHAGEQVPLDVIDLFRKQITIHGNHYAPRLQIAHVLGLVAQGRLKPVIYGTYPLSAVQDAARATADRSVFGKMVLIPG